MFLQCPQAKLFTESDSESDWEERIEAERQRRKNLNAQAADKRRLAREAAERRIAAAQSSNTLPPPRDSQGGEVPGGVAKGVELPSIPVASNVGAPTTAATAGLNTTQVRNVSNVLRGNLRMGQDRSLHASGTTGEAGSADLVVIGEELPGDPIVVEEEEEEGVPPVAPPIPFSADAPANQNEAVSTEVLYSAENSVFEASAQSPPKSSRLFPSR